MKFLNEDRLLNNGTDEYRKLRRDALEILGSALDAVDPKKAIFDKVKREGNLLRAGGKVYDLTEFKRIFVVGGGKAGGPMAEAIESLLGNKIVGGIVNVLKGTEKQYRLRQVKIVGASHPVPNAAGAKGVNDMLRLVSNLNGNDLVIVLISGGGSSLLPSPADGVSLSDLQDITSILLKKGATINDLNAVRKHLDSFKGGQLVKRCHPAEVLSLILSDVVGDPLDTIASGPTAPDYTTWSDAEKVLKKYDLWNDSPAPIKARIELGVNNMLEDTPKASDPIFSKVNNVIIANNSHAAEAAASKAQALGYNSMILSTMVEGEARYVGNVYSGLAREIVSNGRPLNSPAAIFVGGETTVNVKGSGKGGRNQEVSLGASTGIANLPCLIASLATDGLDGPTDSAGAIVDGSTFERAMKLGLSIDDSLKENDSYPFFFKLGDLLITGSTGTNVNDLALILVADK